MTQISQPQIVEESSVTEDRRLRVQALKLRRMSVKAIAAVLGETVHTVEADLEYLRQANVDKFGATPAIDPSQEIGWAIADFEEMESVAWLEFHQLKQEAQQRRLSPMFVARARQGWIRTAAMMRVLRLKLLGEHGYLLPQASKMATAAGHVIPQADQLRAMLRSEGLLAEVASAMDAKALLADGPPEPDPVAEALDWNDVSQWLDDGGLLGGFE